MPTRFDMLCRGVVMAGLVALTACTSVDMPPRRTVAGSVNAPPPSFATADDSLLIYTLWTWQGTQLANGTRIIPEAPARYTVEFQPGGNVNVRADCNHGAGKWQQNGARLTITSIALTKVGCASGSRDRDFVEELGRVVEQSLADSGLVLTLSAGAGSMRFSTPRP